MKKLLYILLIVVVLLLAAVVGGSFYMLDYALAPETNREDTDSCFNRLFEVYPETVSWLDSLRQAGAMRDTFMLSSEGGKRLHARYIDRGSNKTAIVIHGWRDCSIDFLYLGRMYEFEFGYNLVMPDVQACGLSEGEAIRMGWKDRRDMLLWMKMFQTDTMTVHGVSMGGATTMMLSGEEMPEGIRSLCFVSDCGYTDVWEEFSFQLRDQFGLPAFPLLYATSILCGLKYGWTFSEASALKQVAKCNYPMLFIHGENDTFVPTEMVYRLYDAKPGEKELWIAPGAVHAKSYLRHRDDYIATVREFLRKYQ